MARTLLAVVPHRWRLWRIRDDRRYWGARGLGFLAASSNAGKMAVEPPCSPMATCRGRVNAVARARGQVRPSVVALRFCTSVVGSSERRQSEYAIDYEKFVVCRLAGSVLDGMDVPTAPSGRVDSLSVGG